MAHHFTIRNRKPSGYDSELVVVGVEYETQDFKPVYGGGIQVGETVTISAINNMVCNGHIVTLLPNKI